MGKIKETHMNESRETMKEEIGNRIKLIRKNLGLSMEDFGKLFTPKASKGVVSNWENNYNLPNNERLKKIAELGNVTTSYLLEGDIKVNFNEIVWDDFQKDPRKIAMLESIANTFGNTVRDLADSAAVAFDDVDVQTNDIQKNLFILRAREFLDIYSPETIGLVASTLQRFNEIHDEIQNTNKSTNELKEYIETEINEMIELSQVVYDSVKETLYNEIDNKK